MTTDFGVDIHTPNAMGVDPYFSLVSGVDALVERLLRRLVTARGSLELIGDDPAFGYDVRAHLYEEDSDTGAIATAVNDELAKDECVEVVTSAVSFDEGGGSLRIAANVLSAFGPFKLVLAVDAVSASVLAVEAA